MMFSPCLREIFESSKKDSFLIDRGFLWASNGHSQIRPSMTFLSCKTISLPHWHCYLNASKPCSKSNMKMTWSTVGGLLANSWLIVFWGSLFFTFSKKSQKHDDDDDVDSVPIVDF